MEEGDRGSLPFQRKIYPPSPSFLPPSLRYHHVTVLSFTWTAYAARHPGVYFIAMNYTVHAVMYSYYFLMAINAKPKWLKYVPSGEGRERERGGGREGGREGGAEGKEGNLMPYVCFSFAFFPPSVPTSVPCT